MEIIQLYSFMIFMAVGGFLFWEERLFKKGLVKIKGKVVGFSKGKSNKNKRAFYPVVEFTHPSGQLGWLELYKPNKPLRSKIGQEVCLLTDRNDFHLTRETSSLSSEWAAIFFIVAVVNLYCFLDVPKSALGETLLLALVFGAIGYFAIRELWRMYDQDLNLTSAWRESRLKIVKSKVYNENEVGNIKFWDKDGCLKVFKRHNLIQNVYLTFGCIVVTVLLFMGLKAYIETEQFYSATKKTTATIVQISSSGKPVYEYYDIEGIAHRVLSRHELGLKKFGDSFNVLYHPYDQRLWFDDNKFIHYEAIFLIGFALLLGLEFLFFYHFIPRFDLSLLPITSSEELIVKKAS